MLKATVNSIREVKEDAQAQPVAKEKALIFAKKSIGKFEINFDYFSAADEKAEKEDSYAAWYNYAAAGYESYWDENGYEYDHEAEGWYQDHDGEWRQDPAYAQYYEEYYRHFYEHQQRETQAQQGQSSTASTSLTDTKKVWNLAPISLIELLRKMNDGLCVSDRRFLRFSSTFSQQ